MLEALKRLSTDFSGLPRFTHHVDGEDKQQRHHHERSGSRGSAPACSSPCSAS